MLQRLSHSAPPSTFGNSLDQLSVHAGCVKPIQNARSAFSSQQGSSALAGSDLARPGISPAMARRVAPRRSRP